MPPGSDKIIIKTNRVVHPKGGGPWPANALVTTTEEELKAAGVPPEAYEIIPAPGTGTPEKPETRNSKLET